MLDMGEKIKILREKEKWTQKELAAKIGMKSSSGISQYIAMFFSENKKTHTKCMHS